MPLFAAVQDTSAGKDGKHEQNEEREGGKDHEYQYNCVKLQQFFFFPVG